MSGTVKRKERDCKKKNRIMYFFIKNSFSSLYLKVSPSEPLERWATMWPQWTPSYHMKHFSSELEETAPGEEKSCVIYDIGPCSYTDSLLHVNSKVWSPYVKRFKLGFRKLLSPPFCISLLLTWWFWRREVSRPPLSWLWGTFHIASGVCHCD